MLTRRKIFLAHLWHFKVISFEDSTFIHSLFSLYQHLVQNTCNKPYGMHTSGARKQATNIGICVFSRNPYVCRRISEKQECLRSLSIQSVFVN